MGLPLLSPYLQSVGSDFRHGANFATLASTALPPNTSLFVTGISPFSLAIQLRQMKELSSRAIASDDASGQLPPPGVLRDSLYTIDIGQNDFTSNLASQGIERVKRTLPSVISQISQTMQDLYSIRARKFMVFNMAPIGCYPAFLAELPHGSHDLDEYGCMTSYNSAVVYYNELLNNSLAKVRKTLQGASIVYVNKYSVMLELFRHPEDHGLKYGTKACCGCGGGAYNFSPDLYCGTSKVVKGNIASATACGDPQNYVSWDGIHATEAANNIIASAVMSGAYSYPPSGLSKLCQP
uniref:GDSL esterase/lipase n=2 Tax=Triticum urartu TaxID=4572 RepID=A0A8R7QZ85_TRIUA